MGFLALNPTQGLGPDYYRDAHGDNLEGVVVIRAVEDASTEGLQGFIVFWALLAGM